MSVRLNYKKNENEFQTSQNRLKTEKAGGNFFKNW